MHRPLTLLSATLAGLCAGAMLFIEVVLVPFWRGAPPREFRTWFARHSGRIRSVMIPLGGGAAVAAVGTATVEALSADGTALGTLVSAGATSGVVAITLAVNEPLNDRFVQPDLPDRETAELLQRWARWHRVRVVLGVVGALAAATSSMRRH